MSSQFRSVPNTFRQRLESGRFTFTTEATPPLGFVTSGLIRKIEPLKGKIDALSVTDCALSKMRMNAMMFAFQVQETLGIPTIAHVTCRDRNSMALQADLLGAYSLGIENFVAMRGDSVASGTEKTAKGVFHHQSTSLLLLAAKLNRGKSESEVPIKFPPNLFFGAVANPSLPNQRKEAQRVAEKISAGAQFILTQPIFDHRIMRSFIMYLTEYEAMGKVPIILGIMPIHSLENAQFLNQNVPGLFVPAETLIKFQKNDSPETGIAICKQTVEDLKKLVQGIHIFPTGNFEVVEKFLEYRPSENSPQATPAPAPAS